MTSFQSDTTDDTIQMSFSLEVVGFLYDQYDAHDVILEYGSGGSTLLAASQEHSLVMSVENDEAWAQKVRKNLAELAPEAPVHVHWVNIGPTASWGRPRRDPVQRGDHWQSYPNYALNIWDQPFFKHPDLVLIDGRFRPACFLATMMRIERPVTVLFDDYCNRPAYHFVERYAAPVETVGNMARFTLDPMVWPKEDLTQIVQAFLDPY